MGESTLGGGGGAKMLSHCIAFQGCPCLNFNHGDIGAYFSKHLHNMVYYNTKNSIAKKNSFFQLILWGSKIYFWQKHCRSPCIKECKYTQKMIENDFLSLWNFYYLLNIVIPYNWNKFVSHVKSLIIIISQMGVFVGYDHKYVVN